MTYQTIPKESHRIKDAKPQWEETIYREMQGVLSPAGKYVLMESQNLGRQNLDLRDKERIATPQPRFPSKDHQVDHSDSDGLDQVRKEKEKIDSGRRVDDLTKKMGNGQIAEIFPLLHVGERERGF